MTKSLLLAATLFNPAILFAQHGPIADRPARVYTTQPIAAADVAGWRADLSQLVTELERNHPEPYNQTPRQTFAAAVTTLNERIPGLAAHEIIVELQRLAALIGDGHTNINLAAAAGVDFHQLPVRFGLYPDGVYIEAADAAYSEAVGGRVVAIGGVGIDSVMALMRPLIARDNDEWIPVATPNFLNLIEVLHALRLSKDLTGARVRIQRDGQTREVDVLPLATTRPRPAGYPLLPRYTSTWVDARDKAGAKVPLYQQRLPEVHWWQYQESDRLLYIKWDQVQNRSSAATAFATFREAMEFARANPARVDKVLIDIRNNTGGEGGLLDPIIREIVRTREADEPGKLFVAIGPRTFSAALLMSVQLQRYTAATFVGEPTGGKPNVHAGHVFVTLRNSGVAMAISPDFYQSAMPNDTREFVAPRLYVPLTFADYASNRDPVYDAVVAYRPIAISGELEAAIVAGDTVRAEKMLRAYSANPIHRFNGGAPIVNALGYRFLRERNMKAAVQTMRMNVRVHPEYTNGWDSLGEVYLEAGDGANAMKAFEEVLRREPANGRAREMLARAQSTHGG